ncbi:MAG TPA: hypothetical protein DCQ56_00265 [Porphyromonadaceae bacterium]|nr:hypothetical protein [Porphyromonadaceae bacterium]
MKKKHLLIAGAIALVAGMLTACGSGGGATAETTSLPTDGILGELPKVVADYEAAEAAAAAKYEELKQTDKEKATEFWSDYIGQGNTTKFKKVTLPAVEKTLEGKEIPTEIADGLPLKMEKNLTLDDKRNASGSAVFLDGATNETCKVMNYVVVAYDADGNAIYIDNVSFSDYPIKAGKRLRLDMYIAVKDYDAARWARLQKAVVIDKESEAYKQAEEQIKANKEAFKNKE